MCCEIYMKLIFDKTDAEADDYDYYDDNDDENPFLCALLQRSRIISYKRFCGVFLGAQRECGGF